MVADKAPKGGLMTLVNLVDVLRFPGLKFLVICMDTVMPTKRRLGCRAATDHSAVSRFGTALAGRGEVRGLLYCR